MLDEHKNRFRSDADFDFFVSQFEKAAEADLTPIWGKKRHLATLVSPAQTRTLVQKRILHRILDDPSFLDDIKERIENDDIID